jgi:sugar lactone lactonase YvrE
MQSVWIKNRGQKVRRCVAGALTLILVSCGGGESGSTKAPASVATGPTQVHTLSVPTQVPAATITLLAGNVGGEGNLDGSPATAASFNLPSAVAMDAAGTAYVTDAENGTIRMITSAGVVSTLAGTPGVFGSADGIGAEASFSQLGGIAVDSAGSTVYVADSLNSTIRMITVATGEVTTLIGIAGVTGSVDATGYAASFSSPGGVALDSTGSTLYVADVGNSTIRKIALPAGDVTTLAGMAGVSGHVDASGTAARFQLLTGLALDGLGNLYVADTTIIGSGTVSNTVRKIIISGASSGLVSTLTPSGIGPSAGALGFIGLAADGSGSVYVSDTANNVIRKIDSSTGVVSLFAGVATCPGSPTPTTCPGSVDGPGASASFFAPSGLALNSAGTELYVADLLNSTIRQITVPTAVVSTWAGTPSISGSADGTGNAACFFGPEGVALNSAGTVLYVADTGNSTIRQITPSTAAVTTWTANTAGNTLFALPIGVVVDNTGTAYVADTGNNVIRQITPTGVVTELAGSPTGVAGSADGTGTAARFYGPGGLALDSTGTVLYVTDTGNNTIRQITLPAGVVTTVAGTAGTVGSTNATGAAASFSGPIGIAVQGTGSSTVLYVADTGNNTIRQISSAGVVGTLAGTAGAVGTPIVGSADGIGAEAKFNQPFGLAWDSTGQALYVTDSSNSTIRKIVPVTGVVSTVAGVAGVQGANLAAGVLNHPGGIAVVGNATTPTQPTLYVTNQSAVLTVVPDASPSTATATIKATPNSMFAGSNNQTTLTWTSTNATACMASGDWSGSQSTSGSSLVTLPPVAVTTTFTYTLTCGTSQPATATVVVTAPSGPAPTIDTFSASPSSLPFTGSGLTTTLTWTSTGATSCAVSGDLTANLPASGGKAITVAAAKVYTFSLVCTGAGGPSAASTATFTVTPPKPVITMYSSPSTIAVGGSSTLTWSTAYATSCAASDWTLSVATSGTAIVTPIVAAGTALPITRAYTMTCTGPGGSTTQAAVITITAVAVTPPTTAVTPIRNNNSTGAFDFSVLFGLGAIGVLRRRKAA